MAEPQLVTITGKFSRQDGTPESGTIEFQVPGLLRSQAHDESKTPGKFTRMLDADGVLSMPVWATDDPAWTPLNWTYKVIINLSTYRSVIWVSVPIASFGGTLDMSDIMPALTESQGAAYAPLTHTHPEYEGGGGGPGAVTSVAGRTGVVVLSKSDVGLANVDNTADAAKPVSTAQQNALNLKANLASPTFTGTVSGVTKSMVGLGNVDNTADSAKPVSTAQQTALNLKADASAVTTALSTKADLVGGVVPTSQIPAVMVVEYLGTAANQAAMLAKVGQPGDWVNRVDTGTTWQITGADPTQLANWTEMLYPASPVQSVAGRTGAVTLAKADVGLSNVDNTSDAAKPISTATQTALNGKLSAVPNPLPLAEVAAPAAPAADVAILYTRDVNGLTEPEYQTSNGFIARLLRDNLAIAQNATGATIPKGTPVYLTGVTNGTDGVPIVAPAQATADASKLPCIALAAQDILANSYGRIMSLGRLDNINTSAFTTGQRLFVSATAGVLTNTYPATTIASQRVCVVGRVHATTGTLWVDVLTMIHDSAGTRRNTYAVGDGAAGSKSFQFVNAAGTHALGANPTAARTWTLPDASGGVGLCPMVWNGSAYVEAPLGRTYVGPTDPGSVPDGSDWIDTDA